MHHNAIKQGIEIIRDYDSLEPIKCFPDQLNQVWSNLIQNAIHALNSQQQTAKRQINIKLYQEQQYQIVKISDNGCGIASEIKQDIFNPLYTTKPHGEGTGLGLDIVKRIITAHYGEIKLQSVVNKGSSFFVYLPIKIDKKGSNNE